MVWYICAMSERQKESSAQEYNALVGSLRAKVSLGIDIIGGRISSKEKGFNIARFIPRPVELKVKRDKKGLIDIMLKVDTNDVGMGGESFRIQHLIETRNILGKSRLRYYEEVEKTTSEGVFTRTPIVLGDEPSVRELKRFDRILDSLFEAPETKPIETAYVVLPPEDAYKVVKHLEGLGFEQNGLGGIGCWGKDGYYLMHTFEDDDGRMVSVERFIDRTVIEMGEDLARYLANSGFSA